MFLNVNSERVALYKEFNDAFKEYMAKRMTQEEYATICKIVTEGFVELSVEILALEAYLAGTNNNNTTNTVTALSSASSPEPALPRTRSLINSPEHAQLIREVQLLEKQKLSVTVEGQKWAMEKEAQEVQDQKDREAEQQLDRVVDKEQGESEASSEPSAQPQLKLSVVEWQSKMDENRDSLNQIVEDINEKLADIQEAIAVLVLNFTRISNHYGYTLFTTSMIFLNKFFGVVQPSTGTPILALIYAIAGALFTVLSFGRWIMPHAEADLSIPWGVLSLLLFVTGVYGYWAVTRGNTWHHRQFVSASWGFLLMLLCWAVVYIAVEGHDVEKVNSGCVALSDWTVRVCDDYRKKAVVVSSVMTTISMVLGVYLTLVVSRWVTALELNDYQEEERRLEEWRNGQGENPNSVYKV
ncbi:hypothetical protein BG003_011749 [Podila horticola]|nr:hypothetical protein BG003_011749 [Podila horticola]